ncbi:MAG: hypothetical protein ACXAB4_06845 [Candidatus Hodarchaeales archaeon]|jgi:hypothetical protein
MRIKNQLIRETLVIILIAFLGCQRPVSNEQSHALPSSVLLPQQNQPAIDYEVLYENTTVTNGDMIRDSIWERVASWDVSEFGIFGMLQLYHDQRYINGLLTYTEDIEWVGVQIGESSDLECMENGSDGWIFGNSPRYPISYTGDIWFEGQEIPYSDLVNDISYEHLTSEDQGIIEFRRLLVTSDTSGRDVQFESGSTHLLLFASAASHAAERESIVILISNDTLPTQATSSPAFTSFHEKNIEDSIATIFFVGIFLGSLLGTIILFDKRHLLE